MTLMEATQIHTDTPITIRIDGATHQVQMQPNQCILHAALELDLDAPHACQEGECGMCRARLISGKIEMKANQVLDQHDLDSGLILTCQSLPRSNDVIVDYDQI